VIVGFIGAGRVAPLEAAGHDVRVLVRDPADHAKRSDLEQLGAAVVNEVADAAAQADVVVLCVFTDEQVRQVCLDSALLSTMGSGSTLVVHTTASPKTIEAIAARSNDVDVVDAPVSGGPHDIAAGKLPLFVGVPAERFDMTSLRSFSVRHESATVSVTVRHSIVTVPARPNPRR
jgi:3-hydroxyisobutyrate dehydrogenase-like beta-hydroxyacid dehydrogenase